MRVENVRIVVKTAPILAARGRSPLLAVRLPTARRRLSLDRSRRQKNRPCQYGSGGKKLPFHWISPLKIELQQEYRLLAQPVFTEKPSISPLRRRALAESLQSVSTWPPELERKDFCQAAHDRKQPTIADAEKIADAELDAEVSRPHSRIERSTASPLESQTSAEWFRPVARPLPSANGLRLVRGPIHPSAATPWRRCQSRQA